MHKPITSSYKKTKSGSHTVRWRDSNGRSCQKTFHTKPQALQLQKQLWTGKHPVNEKNEGIKFSDFTSIFIRRHCSLRAPATEKTYRLDIQNHMIEYFGNMCLDRIEEDDVIQWMEQLIEDKDPTPKSLQNWRRLLHKIFECATVWKFKDDFGERRPYVRHNPVTKTSCLLDQVEVDITAWTESEKTKFLSYIRDRDPFVYEVTHLILGTGLRRGEVHALKSEHLDFENRMITVKESFCFSSRQFKHTKSKKIRRVPMNEETYSLLLKYGRYPKEARLYENQNVEHLSYPLGKWCKKAKVSRVGIHGLRHTFGTSLARAGVDSKRIQSMMGHADLKTTLRYIHLVSEDLKGSTDLIQSGVNPDERKSVVIPTPKNRPNTEQYRRVFPVGSPQDDVFI